MVVIHNTGVVDKPTGWTVYTVGINDFLIATCFHRREDGLATLLRIAADACEQPYAKDRLSAHGRLMGGYRHGKDE